MTAHAPIVSTTEAMADAIVARLRTKLPDFRVDHFPDAPEKHPFAAAGSWLLVAHEGSDFGAPLSIRPVHQDRTSEFSVLLVLRSLRGPQGASATLDRVRGALQGVRLPQGGTPIVMKRERFVSQDNGVWRFASVATVTIPTVADVVALAGPAFTTLTLEGTGS